eukprot:11184471-Lingulodinium_polyedra.AAC.1
MCAEPPMAFRTDRFGILFGLRLGERRCCAGGRPRAYVRRRVWFLLEDPDFAVYDEQSALAVLK